MAVENFLQSLSETIEANYTIAHTSKLLRDNFPVPLLASALYLLLIFSGKKWMEKRSPFRLKRLLTMWNSFLAFFSIAGFLMYFPPLIEMIYKRGYVHAVCHSYISERATLSFFGTFFVYSKILEFGDTFFIVLRKTPLSFLHWYHHVTVLLYTWYGFATRNSAGHWFSAINMGVHGCMYSYYMLKSMGFRIPSSIAKAITIMQLAQFAVGLLLVFTGVWVNWSSRMIDCGMNVIHVRAGFLMYGSYFILFLNFFYHRYIKPSAKKEKKEE